MDKQPVKCLFSHVSWTATRLHLKLHLNKWPLLAHWSKGTTAIRHKKDSNLKNIFYQLWCRTIAKKIILRSSGNLIDPARFLRSNRPCGDTGTSCRIPAAHRRLLAGSLRSPAPLSGVTVKRLFGRSCCTSNRQPELKEPMGVWLNLSRVSSGSLDSILKAIYLTAETTVTLGSMWRWLSGPDSRGRHWHKSMITFCVLLFSTVYSVLLLLHKHSIIFIKDYV